VCFGSNSLAGQFITITKGKNIMKKKQAIPIVQNLVAKFARQFNKAHVFADKTQYKRKDKHRASEFSLIFC
jgi:hypothetical protein